MGIVGERVRMMGMGENGEDWLGKVGNCRKWWQLLGNGWE